MLSSPANESYFSRLDAYGVPVVVIGKVEGEYNNICSVDTDNFRDSFTLTETFIKQGHRKIACLHAPLDYHVSIDRLAGYKASLEHNQIDIHPDWMIDGGYTHESALAAACRLLSSANPPDAVFATDSMKLLSLYRAADELNLMIPEQLAVAGYSDPMLSLILTPAPGGFDIPTQKLGEESCDLLFKRIAGTPAPQKSWWIPTFRLPRRYANTRGTRPGDRPVRTRNSRPRPHSGNDRCRLHHGFPIRRHIPASWRDHY